MCVLFTYCRETVRRGNIDWRDAAHVRVAEATAAQGRERERVSDECVIGVRRCE